MGCSPVAGRLCSPKYLGLQAPSNPARGGDHVLLHPVSPIPGSTWKKG